jgi:hypothetical protein
MDPGLPGAGGVDAAGLRVQFVGNDSKIRSLVLA